MLHWAEQEALRAQYPAPWVDLLLETLKLVDDVEARHLTTSEAAVRAKARFAALMLERVPDCQARVNVYQQRIAVEEAGRNQAAAEYEEKRQAAIAGEKLRLEQEAKDRNAEIYANAREAELRQQEQWKQKYDEMEKMRREKHEKDRLSAEEAARKGVALLDAIEKG